MDIDDGRNYEFHYVQIHSKNPELLSKHTKMIFHSSNIIFEHFAMYCVNDYGTNQS